MKLESYQLVEALLSGAPPKRALNEDVAEPRDVIYQDKVIKDGTLVCPHCGEEIGEKSTYSPPDDLSTTRHRPCDGIIKFRPPDDETLKHIEKAWGIRLNKETNKWEPINRPSTGKMEDEEPDDYDEYD